MIELTVTGGTVRAGIAYRSATPGFENEPPGRQRTIAPHGTVGVEVHGEDAIPAQRERRVTPRPIGVCARDDRGCDEQAGDRAGYHGTIRPTITGQTAMPKK